MAKAARPFATLPTFRGPATDIVALAAAVLLLHYFRTILWPFTLAIVIVVLIQAFLRATLKVWPGASRGGVIAVGGLVAVVGLGSVIVLVLPNLAELATGAPNLLPKLNAELVAISDRLGLEEPITLDLVASNSQVRSALAGFLSALRGAASGLALTTLFVVFLLACQARIVARITRLARREVLLPRLRQCVRGVEGFLWIQAVTGVVNASVAAVVMAAVGLDHWLWWALSLFVLSFIPFLGVAVGSAGPAVLALLQFEMPWPAVIVFGVIQASAFLVGNFLTPKLQADRQNLDPAAGLLAIGAWTLMWGLPGAFLAVPLTLAIGYNLAASARYRWIAVLISNDGRP